MYTYKNFFSTKLNCERLSLDGVFGVTCCCAVVWRCLPVTRAVFLLFVMLLTSLIFDQTFIDNQSEKNYIVTNHQ